MIQFTLKVVPPTTTHQSKKIVRADKFTKLADTPELQAAKKLLEVLVLPHQPNEPLRGPVELTLVFTWPWLKGHTKKFRSAPRRWKWTKPDASNLGKTFEDVLVRMRFLEDDNQVARLIVDKYWGQEPGIEVSIKPLWEPAP